MFSQELDGSGHQCSSTVQHQSTTVAGLIVFKNCIVADGCILEGNARQSVLFRQVTLAKGAVVENSMIMNDTVVGENCELRCVILDKDVVVRPNSKLIGTPKNPIIITRGEVV